MLFQQIGRSIRFNLHKDGIVKDLCEKGDFPL